MSDRSPDNRNEFYWQNEGEEYTASSRNGKSSSPKPVSTAHRGPDTSSSSVEREYSGRQSEYSADRSENSGWQSSGSPTRKDNPREWADPSSVNLDEDVWERRDSSHKKKRRKKSNKALIVIIVILVVGMVVAGWQLGKILLGYSRDRTAYSDLAAAALFSFDNDGILSEEWTDDFVSEIPISVDWEYLEEVNPEIIGWLYCPDTIINYPVLQTDDNSYYLTHGYDGSSNGAGALFADMDSVAGIERSNFIIYGHNMKDGSMFGSFQGYKEESYYEEHPIMYYLSPTENFRIDLFCCYVVEGVMSNYPSYFSTLADYQYYLNARAAESYWVDYDVMSSDYQLATLSTCTSNSNFSSPRLVLLGMMVPIQ